MDEREIEVDKKLQEVLQGVLDLVLRELDGSVELIAEEHMEKVKSLLNITWDPADIFYNKTNLVLTDINDFEAVSPLLKEGDVVAKLELAEFNEYVYIIRIVNMKELYNLLCGAVND